MEGRLEERASVGREVILEVDAERAWEAISDPAELGRWLADEVELEPVEGAPARFCVDGEERPGRVEGVVEGRELSFSWEREPGRVSVVELQLTPCVSGIRLTVRETDLGPVALGGYWAPRLRRLQALCALVPA